MKLRHLFEYELERRKYVTIKGKPPEDFVQYLRSAQEVEDTLRETYGRITLESIVHLFAEHNIAIADSVTMKVKTSALYPFREYDRDPSSGYTGKHSLEEYEDLKDKISKNGITDPVGLIMERDRSSGDVKAYLGEGNHRLRIARELGITDIPIRFTYYK